MSATHRSAEEIGRTSQGPRPLPDLERPRTHDAPDTADRVLDNGLRVIAARHGSVPMVELRLRIPFADDDALHPARAEVLADSLLTGAGERDRVRMDTDLAAVGGDLQAGVDPERLTLSGSALSDGMDTLLEVVSDALTAPAYREDEVAGPPEFGERHGRDHRHRPDREVDDSTPAVGDDHAHRERGIHRAGAHADQRVEQPFAHGRIASSRRL